MVPTSPSAALFDRWSGTHDRPGLQLFTYRPIHDAVLARIDGLEPYVAGNKWDLLGAR